MTFKAQVAREFHETEKVKFAEFVVPEKDIYYATDSFDADKFATMAIADIEKESSDHVSVGFDTEGSIKVLQLYFTFNERKYALVFQLNKLIYNGKAPNGLVRLLSHPAIVFSGKKVNEEVIEVMTMMSIDEAVIARTKIVETQRCFELIEMISKGERFAFRYLEHGHYTPSYALPKNPFVAIDKQQQEDLGLKFIFRFFFPEETVSKLYEMRCPLFCDWSCLNKQMSQTMLQYAAGDAATGLRALFECHAALEEMGFAWTDLIERVDLNNSHNKNSPFESLQLTQFFR